MINKRRIWLFSVCRHERYN